MSAVHRNYTFKSESRIMATCSLETTRKLERFCNDGKFRFSFEYRNGLR